MNKQGEYIVDLGKYVIGYGLGASEGDMDCAVAVERLEDGTYLVVDTMYREHKEYNETTSFL
jgi:hypothetical protein